MPSTSPTGPRKEADRDASADMHQQQVGTADAPIKTSVSPPQARQENARGELGDADNNLTRPKELVVSR